MEIIRYDINVNVLLFFGMHRKVAIINLDPANDSLPYPFPLYIWVYRIIKKIYGFIVFLLFCL